jgi:ABC-type tungstate transport system permease subunit
MQALNESINQKEYTLTDWATLSSLAANLRDQTTIFKAGSDNATDPLLNPAHMLLGAKAPNPDVANTFLNWMVGAGQDVIIRFAKNGQVLYSPAPKE